MSRILVVAVVIVFCGGLVGSVYAQTVGDRTQELVAALLPGAEIVKLIVSLGIASALLAWARRAELSCDRSALLVTQDAHVIGRTMMKLAGGTFASKIDYELFLEQGRDFKKNYDANRLDRFWADVMNSGLSHPFPIWRVAEILEWVETGQYADLMAKK